MEVFLVLTPIDAPVLGFLHVRGGVSHTCARDTREQKFSPRAWRCFCRTAPYTVRRSVFSTCVEVFPERPAAREPLDSFLHVRGGGSHVTHFNAPNKRVFSTCVEVFLEELHKVVKDASFLHVRGGVSSWGLLPVPSRLVFSTCVEVFPWWTP